MKIKTTLIISMMIITLISVTLTTTSQQTIETQAINDELLGYWSFENCNETLVFDDSENHNNFSFIGNDFGPNSKTNGLFGQCMYFDGVDDCLSFPDTLLTKNEGSISLWFKRTGESNGEYNAGGLYRNGFSQPVLRVQNTGEWHPGFFQVHWAYADGMTHGGNYKSYSDYYPASLNNWNYAVFSWTSTHYYIFYNGQIVEENDFIPSDVTGSDTMIGKYGLDNYFNGCIDEVRIYNRALSTEEVSTYYYSVRDNLMGYWSFENYDDVQVFDDSQNDNRGLFYGEDFGPSSITDGIAGNALEFDGIDDYLVVENDYCYSPTSPLCMEGWIYPIKLSYNEDWHYYFGMRGFNSGIVHMADGKIKAEFRNKTGAINCYPIIEEPENRWYHIVWQWSDGKFQVYVNKEKVVDEYHADHQNYIKNFTISTAPHVPGINSWNHVNAKFDEIKIWDRALTHEEINTTYEQYSITPDGITVDYLFNEMIYIEDIDLNLTNAGDISISEVDYNITISGGLLNLINNSVEGKINELLPGDSIAITTEEKPITFGLGSVYIDVKLTLHSTELDSISIEETFTGFVIGKIIIVL